MHLFRTLLTLLAFVLIVGVANAGNVAIFPQEQEIPIGGEGYYRIGVSYASLECGQHYINIFFYENNILTDKLIAALQGDNESANLQLVERGFGYYNYSWYASCDSPSYSVTFDLVVAFNNSATEPVQVGDVFKIRVKDSLSGEAEALATATAYAIAIPELLTFALVGAGVAVIFVSRKY